MENIFKRELKKKAKKDSRFTLILMIGSAFLLFILSQVIQTNSPDALNDRGSSLKVIAGSLFMVALDQHEKESSAIPWNLTPFFFEKLPINEADKEALTTVKGIGPKLADSILQHRLAYGPFKEGADLLKISGIGPKRAFYFEKMFDFDHK